MEKIQPYSSIYSEIYDYDVWYSTYNYTENTRRIVELIENVSNNSLLELASGTGSYLLAFSEYYSHVEGLELATDMVDISLRKYPDFRVHLSDMTNFNLAQRYDTIALLCGTIAVIAQSTEAESVLAIQKIIRCSRKHLKPKGIVIIETYEQPHNLKEWVLAEQHTLEDKHVSHHSVKTRENSRFAVLTHHFLITSKVPNSPTIYKQEIVRNYLCTAEELISLFEEEKFRLKVHVPSFALKGRDLLIFELVED